MRMRQILWFCVFKVSVFKENKVSGVFAFTYEKEAVATDIKIEGASVVRN